jgi:hypothetical protein
MAVSHLESSTLSSHKRPFPFDDDDTLRNDAHDRLCNSPREECRSGIEDFEGCCGKDYDLLTTENLVRFTRLSDPEATVSMPTASEPSQVSSKTQNDSADALHTYGVRMDSKAPLLATIKAFINNKLKVSRAVESPNAKAIAVLQPSLAPLP